MFCDTEYLIRRWEEAVVPEMEERNYGLAATLLIGIVRDFDYEIARTL